MQPGLFLFSWPHGPSCPPGGKEQSVQPGFSGKNSLSRRQLHLPSHRPLSLFLFIADHTLQTNNSYHLVSKGRIHSPCMILRTTCSSQKSRQLHIRKAGCLAICVYAQFPATGKRLQGDSERNAARGLSPPGEYTLPPAHQKIGLPVITGRPINNYDGLLSIIQAHHDRVSSPG